MVGVKTSFRKKKCVTRVAHRRSNTMYYGTDLHSVANDDLMYQVWSVNILML